MTESAQLSPGEPSPDLPSVTRAAVARRYGGPEVLELAEQPVAALAANDVLVAVAAGSLNALDWHRLRGEPYMMRLTEGLRRPKQIAVGADLAGVVTAVGRDVTDLAPGTAVFGQQIGALRDHVVISRELIAPLPDGVTVEEGACFGVAALTALQAVHTHGAVVAGTRVLVTGAAGGVGMFAVQMAKAAGAHVTAETSAAKVAFVEGLGADRVVAHDGGVARGPDRYEVIVDCAGWYPIRTLRRVLTDAGRLVVVGLGSTNPWTVPVGRFLKVPYVRLTSRQRLHVFVADCNQPDLRTIAELAAAGVIRPHLHAVYPLEQLGEALALLERRRVLGKVVIRL